MTAVHSNGVAFEIPDTWSYFILPPRTWSDGYAGVNFRAASMAVPIDDDSVYGSGMVELLGPLDILLVLNEMLPDNAINPGEGYFAQSIPASLSSAHFSGNRLHRALPGQLGYLTPFTASNRAFFLYAVLGSAAAGKQIATLTSVLRSMRIGSERA